MILISIDYHIELNSNVSLEGFWITETKLYTGITIAANAITPANKNARIDCFPVLFMYWFTTTKPIRAPDIIYAHKNTAYSKSSIPAREYKILDDNVENITIYIPVAEATIGGTPKLSINGLKITPPPSPTVPATNPAPNAQSRNLKRRAVSHLRSPSTNSYPFSFLSLYSRFTITMFRIVIIMQNRIRVAYREK